MKRLWPAMAALAMVSLFAESSQAQPPRGGRPGRGGFPGGPPGGPDRFGPPRPGEILPGGLQVQLKLTEEQKKTLAKIQKEVDAQLEKMLTDEQKKMLKEIRERGPRFNGFPGGPGGPPGGFPGRPGDRPGRPGDRPGRPDGRPGDRPGGFPGREGGRPGVDVEGLVKKLMELDKNKDGKLAKDELPALYQGKLFDDANSNDDKVLDEKEIKKLAENLSKGRRGGNRDGFERDGRRGRPEGDRPGRPEGGRPLRRDDN